jgi:hypothetical protein
VSRVPSSCRALPNSQKVALPERADRSSRNSLLGDVLMIGNVKRAGATIVGVKWISPPGALLVGISLVFFMLLAWITSPEKVGEGGYLAGMIWELAIISGVLGLALLIVNVARLFRLCFLSQERK